MPALLRASLFCAALASLAAPAAAGTTAQETAAAAAAPAAPVNDQAAQDRIMALVRTGKCGPAKAEATRVGDHSLADQIGSMCGARSADPFSKRSGGSGASGGAGGGRRGGRGG